VAGAGTGISQISRVGGYGWVGMDEGGTSESQEGGFISNSQKRWGEEGSDPQALGYHITGPGMHIWS
jgi:hypothetical protein